MSDGEKQAYIGEVARILAKCDGWQDPLTPHVEQTSRVYAYGLEPRVERARTLEWLHAEAVWRQSRLEAEHAKRWEKLNSARVEVKRLQREVQFEANAETFDHHSGGV